MSDKIKVQRKIHNRRGFLSWANLRDILIVLVLAIIVWKLVDAIFTFKLGAFFLSALGAVVGVILLQIFTEYIRAWPDRIKRIKIYKCGDHDCFHQKCWNFSETEISGTLHHSFGELITDNEKKVWKFPHADNRNINPNGSFDGGHHVIYGPYVNDFGRQGYYKVVFTIRPNNFKLEETEKNIIKLEIVEVKYTPKQIKKGAGNGYIGENYHQIPIAIKIITRKDLVRAKKINESYAEFKLYFYCSGQGEFEYRAKVFKENLKKDESLYFNTLKVLPSRYL